MRSLSCLWELRYQYLQYYVMQFTKWFPSDRIYLSLLYYAHFKRKIDWKKLRTFNEKLQWLKLYDRQNDYTLLVDKQSAKKIIGEIIGEEHIIPTLGVWDDWNDFMLSKQLLPEKFVLKCTHDSASTVVVDSTKANWNELRVFYEKRLASNFYLLGREWPYKNIIPRLMAEPYMSDDSALNNGGLTDYKFHCFNGNVDNVMVCIDRNIGFPKFYFFDRHWRLLRINKRGKDAPKDFSLPKPQNIDQMFEIASLLSKGKPFVRVDLYVVNQIIYFGELTFYPSSGFDSNLLEETDVLWGNKLILKR